MTDTTRELLARLLERLSDNPDEWTDRETETVVRLSRAAEWEETAERLAVATWTAW